MRKLTQNELLVRHQKIQEKLNQKDIDACLLTGNMNVYYTTGVIAQGYVFVPKKGKAIFFVCQNIENLNIANCDVEKNIQTIQLSKPETILGFVQQKDSDIKSIALECDEISAREYMRLSKAFQGCEIFCATEILREVRSVKTDFELEIIRKDCKKHIELYKEIPSLFENGMTDLEFSAKIEHFFRVNGHLGIFRTFGFRMEAFVGSVLSGKNAYYPSPYDFSLGGKGLSPNMPMSICNEVIEKDTTVQVDMSGNYNGYLIDVTRTFYFGKTVPKRVEELHNLSVKIQKEILKVAKPGTLCSELYDIALELVKKYDALDCFMGIEKQAKFVGHGLGLEINELPVLTPRYSKPLEQGMCIAIEPKFLIKGVGAVGTENTFEVLENSLKNLTKSDQGLIIIGE